jgi:hypothetical protein
MQQKNSCMQYLVQHHRITCATSTNPRRFCDVVLFFCRVIFFYELALKISNKNYHHQPCQKPKPTSILRFLKHHVATKKGYQTQEPTPTSSLWFKIRRVIKYLKKSQPHHIFVNEESAILQNYKLCLKYLWFNK